jgi:hypothetical protein
MYSGCKNETFMKGIKLLFALLVIGVYGTAQPDEIKIIANPNIEASEISRDDLNRIFLMTKTSLAGASHVEPVLKKTGTLRDLFSEKYLERTNLALMTYYRSLMFSGKAAIPRSFDSDFEVAEFVAKTKGAIGYVSGTADTAGVKTLKVK